MIPSEIAHIAYQKHRASQREAELAMAVQLVASIHPQVIVEIGCDAGGTLWVWRQLCDEVYGITLPDNSPPTGGQGYPLVDHGAEVHVGDSHDPASLAWLRAQLDNRMVDVLHIDGDHTYDGAARDFADYSPLVRPGGLVLIHDVLNERVPVSDPGAVARFWAELAEAHPGRTSVLARPWNPVGFGVITKEKA